MIAEGLAWGGGRERSGGRETEVNIALTTWKSWIIIIGSWQLRRNPMFQSICNQQWPFHSSPESLKAELGWGAWRAEAVWGWAGILGTKICGRKTSQGLISRIVRGPDSEKSFLKKQIEHRGNVNFHSPKSILHEECITLTFHTTILRK